MFAAPTISEEILDLKRQRRAILLASRLDGVVDELVLTVRSVDHRVPGTVEVRRAVLLETSR